MNRESLVETVKGGVAQARSKAGMVAAHGQEVVKVGMQTLQAAGKVVKGARREAAQMLDRTRDELKKTLVEGAVQVGEKLSRIASPTRKEQAEAHKAEIKAKKRQRRAQQAGSAEAAQPAA